MAMPLMVDVVYSFSKAPIGIHFAEDIKLIKTFENEVQLSGFRYFHAFTHHV